MLNRAVTRTVHFVETGETEEQKRADRHRNPHVWIFVNMLEVLEDAPRTDRVKRSRANPLGGSFDR